ncbi:hypothetical protein [Synechococcus sp. CBW1107]|uniref:hypothetical protein n=1 Tax=Synechococcus sp. CBW1107 TaxID=2789857 RepID=UPI002AD4AC36|nr:hypothetical protein [Synechococcus sp. CBW1107]CAK6688206.1 hypothetical protein IFHNHDMJ_00356 [Synechococcus sp. CBW1107]
MPAQPAKWVRLVRGAIKQQHGFGWSIREIAGKVQLTRRFEDGSRSAVVLDLRWDAECTGTLLGLLPEIRRRMDGQQLGLREAYELLRAPAAPLQRETNWEELVQRFRQHKTLHTGEIKESTWENAYAPVMARLLEVLHTRPIPRDSRGLLAALRDRYGGAPGSRGRKLRIQYAAQFLRFCVMGMGTAIRWLPPDDLLPFVGRAGRESSQGGATPIKDAQFGLVLGGIPDPRWRLAVGLLGCFGLRPVELKYCKPNGDKLHVAYCKRTARGNGKPGDVPGLDPLGLEGESQHLLHLLLAGEVVLPPLGSTDRSAALSVRQYLDRRQVWQELKREAAETGGRLSAYSFRHGYALRAHEMYNLSPRITAACMRHSLQTHHRHYGAWTDIETIDAAIIRGRMRARSSGHSEREGYSG